jgi:hypothetical protein
MFDMETTRSYNIACLLQFLIEERDKLMFCCDDGIDPDYSLIYESMTDHIASLNKELFEAKLALIYPTEFGIEFLESKAR